METIYRIRDGREFKDRRQAEVEEKLIVIKRLNETPIVVADVCAKLNDRNSKNFYTTERGTFLKLLELYLSRKDDPNFEVAEKFSKKKGVIAEDDDEEDEEGEECEDEDDLE